LVTSSGGTIEVDSRLGQGTTFTITWPRTEQSIEDEVSRVESQTIVAESCTVLMAEDNDSVRAIVKRVLERAGYQVLLARNAEEALQLVQQPEFKPDLLLSDVIMPGMTGPELLTKMREDHPGLRYLFMSGYLGEIADRYDFDPEVDLITKPFSPMELLDRIDQRLNTRG
jgi:CheY-like chemotaxis protein